MGMAASYRTRPITWSSMLLVLLLVCIGGLASRAAIADDEPLIHPTLREFYRTGKYAIFIDGKAQHAARIFQSRRAGGFLVLDTDYGKPLLFLPRQRVVSTVSIDDVPLRPDKGMDVLNKANIVELGELRIDRGGMAINIDGLTSRLQPQRYLVGPKSAEEVLLHSPEYGRAGASYQPSAADVRKIKSADRDVEVVVFFGTWCPTCRRLLPRILKVDGAIDGAKIRITYYGLDKGPGVKPDPKLSHYGVKHIPTGVVLVDGKAVGQISSRNLSRPERAIAGLVR